MHQNITNNKNLAPVYLKTKETIGSISQIASTQAQCGYSAFLGVFQKWFAFVFSSKDGLTFQCPVLKFLRMFSSRVLLSKGPAYLSPAEISQDLWVKSPAKSSLFLKMAC